jgi:DNA-binding NarL/FixJ family response regulator
VPGVYLIFRNQMFKDAVGAILEAQPGIDLVRTTNEPERVAAEISALAPDVILLEEVDGGGLCPILTNPTPCRLITLRLDADGMRIWSQTWRENIRPQDLVEAILDAGEDKT